MVLQMCVCTRVWVTPRDNSGMMAVTSPVSVRMACRACTDVMKGKFHNNPSPSYPTLVHRGSILLSVTRVACLLASQFCPTILICMPHPCLEMGDRRVDTHVVLLMSMYPSHRVLDEFMSHGSRSRSPLLKIDHCFYSSFIFHPVFMKLPTGVQK